MKKKKKEPDRELLTVGHHISMKLNYPSSPEVLSDDSH